MLRRYLVVFVLAACGCAKVTVTHINSAKDAKFKEEGVFYALPKTVVKTQVKVEKSVKTPAKYSRVAAIFSPSLPPVCGKVKDCVGVTPKITYAVQQGATFLTFGEPDPEHLYMVRFAGGGTMDQTISMAWNDLGLVSNASASVTNRTTDVVMSGLKLATSLGSKLFLGAAGVAGALPATCPSNPQAFDPIAIKVLRGGSNPTVVEQLIENYCDMEADERKEYQAPNDATLLTNALAAYQDRVFPLVKARIDMLTGATNVFDRAPLLVKIDEAIEAEIKQLFTGATEKTPWELTFEVRKVDENAPQLLLKLDSAAGVCEEKSLLAADSKPTPNGFNGETLNNCANAKTTVSAAFALHPAADHQVFGAVRARVTEPASGDRSFRYRLPAQVKARVVATTDKKDVEYGSAVFSVAQLGHVVSLPARRASKQMSYDLAFIEATGGLKSFKLGTTGGLDAATIDALSAAGGTVIDAGNAKAKANDADRKAAETAADELTILTRAATLLKLKNEICDIQKKYGIACTIEQ